MIEANDILAYASICISTLIGTLYALQTGRISKLENKIEQLTTHKDQTINDSEKIEKHDLLISAINSKHDLLEQKVGLQYAHILLILEDIKGLTIHKEKGKEQGFNNMATLLESVKSEIVKELHNTIDKKD